MLLAHLLSVFNIPTSQWEFNNVENIDIGFKTQRWGFSRFPVCINPIGLFVSAHTFYNASTKVVIIEVVCWLISCHRQSKWTHFLSYSNSISKWFHTNFTNFVWHPIFVLFFQFYRKIYFFSLYFTIINISWMIFWAKFTTYVAVLSIWKY